MAKRGNSEGSIVRRADGRWEGKLSFPGGKRKSIYGKTRREVAVRLALETIRRGQNMSQQEGEIIECEECGAELEVVSEDPLEFALAPEEEEDWGE